MNMVSAETLRRLIPGLAVAAVLAFSFLAASPSLASSTNNCGVKGYGYHDHGKVCPNRPFPGHGFGVQRILAGGGVVSSDNDTTTTNVTKGKSHSKVSVNLSTAST